MKQAIDRPNPGAAVVNLPQQPEGPFAGSIPEKLPFYLPVKDEVDLFAHAFAYGIPVLLQGPTGCGKTRFVEHMAWKLSRRANGPRFLATVACHEDLSSSDLAGYFLFSASEGTSWVDGPLTTSARHGGICYLDEIVEARADVLVLIHPLSDHRRAMPLPRRGEVVQAHEAFQLVISYNPGYQSSGKSLKPSTRQRFVAIEFDFPGVEREAEILMGEGCSSERLAETLALIAGETRHLARDGHVPEGASTRCLVRAFTLFLSGVGLRAAIGAAIVEPLTDEAPPKKALWEMIVAKGYLDRQV